MRRLDFLMRTVPAAASGMCLSGFKELTFTLGREVRHGLLLRRETRGVRCDREGVMGRAGGGGRGVGGGRDVRDGGSRGVCGGAHGCGSGGGDGVFPWEVEVRARGFLGLCTVICAWHGAKSYSSCGY